MAYSNSVSTQTRSAPQGRRHAGRNAAGAVPPQSPGMAHRRHSRLRTRTRLRRRVLAAAPLLMAIAVSLLVLR